MNPEHERKSKIFEALSQDPETVYPVTRLQEWVDAEQEEDDKELQQELLDSVVRSADNYLEIALRHEHCQNVQIHRLEPEDYKTKLMDLDRVRRISHNSLWDNVRIFTRTLGKKNPTPELKEWWEFCGGGTEGDRYEIGNWGLRIAFAHLMAQREKELQDVV